MDGYGVVFNVLTRLPVKSLIRFMCVSKSWCDLISKDSCFILDHLHFQKAEAGTDALLLPLFLSYSKPSRTNYSTMDYLSLGTSEHRTIQLPWNRPWIRDKKRYFVPHRHLFIAGHCNGLVCISDLHRVIMWNPAIRRFKILPDTDDFNHLLESNTEYGHPSDVQTVVGFGFLPGHEFHYKVVRMMYANSREALSGPGYPSIGELYDSRTGSWRRIADQDVRCLFIKEYTNNSIFVDGSLCWLGKRNKTKAEEEASSNDCVYYYPEITALNLVDEKFRNIELPDQFDLETNSGKRIAVLGESQLGLFAGDHRHRLLLTVWATKVDRVSWIKLFRINLKGDPLCFSRNGKVLLRMGFAHLAMFDPKLREPCHFRDLGYEADDAVGYVESLVLLDGERGEEEPNGDWSTRKRRGRTRKEERKNQTVFGQQKRGEEELNSTEETEGRVGEIEEEDFYEGVSDLFG